MRDAAIDATLDAFREGLRAILGDKLLALYLAGSVLTDDFAPETSDLDFLAVTDGPLSPAELTRVAALHRALPGPWGRRLEGDYVALEHLAPHGAAVPSPSISAGEELRPAVSDMLGAENVLAVRQSGLALHGPPPSDLLPEVDRATLDASLHAYLAELEERLSRPLAAEKRAEALLNVARCRYGLATGCISAKREAAAWLSAREPDLKPALDAALILRRTPCGSATSS